jgi:hypothetical protein
MISTEEPTGRIPELPPYREAPQLIPAGHAWKMICGSIGFQLGLLLVGSTQAGAFGVPLVFLGSAGGVAAGAWLDRPRPGAGSPSGLRHLFVLIFQFALLFAWLKVWGDPSR